MEPQTWSPYAESPMNNRQTRYAPHVPSQPPSSRESNGFANLKHDSYSASASTSRSGSMSVASSHTLQGKGPEHGGDGDGDVPMEDADPYQNPKRASRPQHQRVGSTGLMQAEESSAARRYSPMNLSPASLASPYTASPQQHQSVYNSYGSQPPSEVQSPTRGNPYMSPPHGYYSPPGECSRRCLFPNVSS